MHQPPADRAPMPPADLLGAVAQLYLRAFRPLFLTAAAVAAPPTLLGLLVQPQDPAVWYVWTVLLLAMELAAHSGVLWAALNIHQRRSVHPASVAIAIVAFGPRYFAGAFVLLGILLLASAPAGLDPLAVFLFVPLGIYLTVRLSLFGPAIVLEDCSVVEAFRRSWRLVEGRWWRTFGMEAALLSAPLFGSLISLLLMEAQAGISVLFVANVLITGAVVPLLMCFFLLLFEDYRRITDPIRRYAPEPHDRKRE